MKLQLAQFTNGPLHKIKAYTNPQPRRHFNAFLPRDRPNPSAARRRESRGGPDARGRRCCGGGRCVGRRAPALPAPQLLHAAGVGRGEGEGGGRGVAAAVGVGSGTGERPQGGEAVAVQGARDLLRGDRGGGAHGAAHVGAHRREVGPPRTRLRDQAPHEASGELDSPFALPLLSTSSLTQGVSRSLLLLLVFRFSLLCFGMDQSIS